MIIPVDDFISRKNSKVKDIMESLNQFPIDTHDDVPLPSNNGRFCLDDVKIGDIFFYHFLDDEYIYGSYGIIKDIFSGKIEMEGPMVSGSRKSGDIMNRDGAWFYRDAYFPREIYVKFLGPPKITYEEIRGKIIEQLTPIENSDLPLNSYAVTDVTGSIRKNKLPVIIKAKSKLGAIVGWLDWQRKFRQDKTWFGDGYINIVDFIGVNEDRWLEVLEKYLGKYIGLFEIGETVTFPLLENVKSASKT